MNYIYFYVNLTLSIIIDIFALIYNEFFIINCFGLETGTHYGISQRSVQNSKIEIEMIENESGRISDPEGYIIYNNNS